MLVCHIQIYPIISEWHPEKNGALIPSDFAKFSPEKVWWQCKHGHEWQAPVSNRTQGNGCPFCCNQIVGFGNDLESISPELANEWHPTKNNGLLPNMFTPKNPKSAWWMCSEGHEWKTTIYNRAYGNGCPHCSGRNATATNSLQALMPDLASQWHPTLQWRFNTK